MEIILRNTSSVSATCDSVSQIKFEFQLTLATVCRRKNFFHTEANRMCKHWLHHRLLQDLHNVFHAVASVQSA